VLKTQNVDELQSLFLMRGILVGGGRFGGFRFENEESWLAAVVSVMDGAVGRE
jgi:hypothetical protein